MQKIGHSQKNGVSPIGLAAILWLFLLFFSSCSTIQYLEKDQTFLKKNKIYLKHAQHIHNKKKLKYDLSTVYAQRPNRNFFITTRRWFYYWVQNKQDTTKFNRWVLKQLAEPPAIYDPNKTEQSVSNLKEMMGQKGFFDAEVTYKINTFWRQKTIVKYYVTPNKITKIDSAFLVCPDTSIYKILLNHQHETFIKPNAPLTLDNYNNEVRRIVRLLRNRGYAQFTPAHIAPLAVDTTGQKNVARLSIYLYQDSLQHPTFHIGDIKVYHQFGVAKPLNNPSDTTIAGIQFSPSAPLEVYPKAILPKIAIQKNKLYNIDQIEETQRLLSRLNFYRSINTSQRVSKLDSSKMDIKLYMVPKEKMSIGYSTEFNNSNVGTTGQSGSFLGVGGNVNFEHRNVFHGSELLRLNMDAGLDIPLTGKSKNTSYNFAFKGDLFFPKYIKTVPFINVGKWMKNRQLDEFAKDIKKFASSRISTSFSFVKVPNWNRYILLRSNMGINYYGQNGSQMNVNNIGLDYFYPQADKPFQEVLNKFEFLNRSFRKQLFTGFIFKNISYNSDTRTDSKDLSFQWGGNFDISGFEIWLANQTYNKILGKNEVFKLGRNEKNLTEYAKYIKLDIHSVVKKKLTNTQSVGALFRIGAAVPYSDTRNVPYVVQFYSGGANSIRAWSIRELGPGGFKDTISLDANLPFYQSGDLKLEMLSEWRFDIYWVFKGALFLDAGNVWTLRKDPERPNGEFSKDFYKQIAVGTGFGIRADLTYFILRFDMGLKMRNPYPDENNYYWLNYGGGFHKLQLRDFKLNIQVGFPF